MKTILQFLFVVLAVFAITHQATAQSSQFFRISGPAATTITAFNPDGTLVWSNAQSDTSYTIQTVLSLPSGTNWVDYVQIPVTNSINTNLLISFNPPDGMALVPAGVFTMGNSIGDSDITNANPTNVYVSAFYMDVNLVSYSQWQSVFNWATDHGYGFIGGVGKATNHPVQRVQWYDVVKWSNARSQKSGLTPVYYTDTNLTQLYTNGQTDAIYANWTNNGYRLPTEAEWEKAARGGLRGQRFPWGNTISWSQANYWGNPGYYSYDVAATNTSAFDPAFNDGVQPLTSPVGSFTPNGYGLYDMAGNVREWCWDWYGTPYNQPTFTNPTGAATGTYRVLRGGGWFDAASRERCAFRDYSLPYVPDYLFGFRCVRRH